MALNQHLAAPEIAILEFAFRTKGKVYNLLHFTLGKIPYIEYGRFFGRSKAGGHIKEVAANAKALAYRHERFGIGIF